MTLKVAYSLKNQFITEFMNPKKAYKTLAKHGRPDFDDFITPVAFQDVGHTHLYALLLGGELWGGVVMCGTTTELKQYLQTNIAKKDKIRAFIAEPSKQKQPPPNVPPSPSNPDLLLAYFVRGKSSVFAEPETLINIGGKEKWWGCINQRSEDFKPGKWKRFPGFVEEYWTIDLKQLEQRLDSCEKDSDGKAIEPISW